MSPGFVDGHTHMDAQIFSGSDRHQLLLPGRHQRGDGQCGFTLAPCREAEADMVFRNLEACRRHQPRRDAGRHQVALESFLEFLDVLETLPKGINYAGYMGHCALRTYVMGQRAFTDEAREDDLARMVHLVKEAVDAGAHADHALGQSSDFDDKPVASRLATGTSSRPW